MYEEEGKRGTSRISDEKRRKRETERNVTKKSNKIE